MPIEKIKGLRGLRGFGDLNEGERKRFLSDHAAELRPYSNDPIKYGIVASRMYENQKFINTFGQAAFDQLHDGTEASYNYRNKLTHDKIVTDAFVDTFSKDDNYDQLATYLDTDGMYDLLNNDEYLGKTKIRNKFIKNINDSKAMQKAYDNSLNIPYAEAALAKGIIMTKTAMNPYEQRKKDEQRDKEILDRLYAESQKRREKDIQDDADIMFANMLDADNNGQKNIANWLKDFDKVASKSSEYYSGFKNSSWLKEYDDENKLKDYAKYQALKQKYGEGVAMQYLGRDIQNRIAEAQDGRFTGNTLKGVLTTAWSDLGSNVALFANIKNWYDVNRMAIINQGKDPDKPVYDKKGNIIDYERNENIWTNPAYWNNVYKYNTFSPTEIKAIEERGGISTDVNVREYGYTPDFFSWDTVQEGFKQGGHVLAGIAETALTGGAGKIIGMGAKGVLKGVGLSAKAMQTASKAGRMANDVLVAATTGLEGSQLEAMGTFDEQMETAKQKIQEQINSELYDYQRSIDYNSKESKAAIDYYYKQLKIKDNRRVTSGSKEGMTQLPMSDETLKAQAKQMYTNQLLDAKQKELQTLHKKDEMEAARAATKAYMTNFAMDYVKNVPLTTAVQKFMIAKGSMRGAFDNTIDKNIIADVEKGGVKRAVGKKIIGKGDEEIRFSSGKGLAKEIGKQFAGGFADEYLDGINASFAGGVGNNIFDNYIKRNYDPEAYDSTVDSFAGNFLAGLSEGLDGVLDRQNLYEGFIGMLSPAATVMPNMNAVFHPRDTWNAVINKKDAYGNKINFAERISSVLMNPLLNSVVEAREKDRRVDNTVAAINMVVAANKDKLDSAAKTISVLNNFNTPINGDNPLGILDYKDNKLLNAFTLIKSLNELEDIGESKSKLYEDTMHTIQGLAEGTLSKEEMDNEVDKFIADPDNKSILDGKENPKEVAAERLQKNAQYFMDMKKKVDEVQQMFANSPSMKNIDPRVAATLVYNTVAKDDYKNRLESILSELGTGSADTESIYTPNYVMRYDRKDSIKKAIAAREKEVEKADKEIESLSASNNYARNKIQQLENQLENSTKEGEKVTLSEDIRKYKELIDSQNFQMKTLRESRERLLREKEDISRIGENEDSKTSFTVDGILNSDVRDMAYILDHKNRENFSKEKQAVIDKSIARLKQKDPEALRKINDAGILASRIDDMETVYNKISNNDKLASTYFDAAEQSRGMAAWGEYIQREIEKKYKDISDAYQNREENPEAFRGAVLDVNSEVVEAYMNDHPKQAEVIRPYYEMLKFNDDAAAILKSSNYRDEDKMMVVKAIDKYQKSSNTMEEFMTKMESVIDAPDMYKNFVNQIDEILSKVEQLGYLRDATIIESRKQRKQREAEEAKKKEEEKNKVDEAAKSAADKKTAEDKATESTNNNNESPFQNVDNIQMDDAVTLKSIEQIAKMTGRTVKEVRRAIAELRTVHDKTKYEAWGTPASAVGNTADIIVRDFFAGELREHYPNITDDVLQHFKKQLEELSKSLKDNGIHIVSKEVMAHGVIESTDEEGAVHKIPIAGTLDLFGYDDNGNYYIFDMKTTRNHSGMKLVAEQSKWSRQISLYADLLKQSYGINVNPNNLRIIPINVAYESPRGDGAGMSLTGPIYSVDKESGQLMMEDINGKLSEYIQKDSDNFQLRQTNVDKLFAPGYTHLNIKWDNLTSIIQDIASENSNIEVKEVQSPDNATKVVEHIVNDTKKYVLSDDENYYYVKDEKTGKKVKYARVTSVIGADKSVVQWMPTNQEVYDYLGENKPKTDTDSEEKIEQTVSALMKDESGDISLTAGDMWYGTVGNAKKGKFAVTKMGDNITFDTDEKNDMLSITSNEYDVTPETKEHEENAVFEASSMEKRGDDWYFVGNFVGTKNTTEVKAKKSFDIEKAIKRQQEAREAELAAKGVDVGNVNIVDNGDSVQGRSENIDEQNNNITPDGKEVQVSEINEDAAELNGIREHNIETNVNTLSGNAMSRYEPDPLAKDGKLVNKKGKDDRKQMDDYYAWMDAAGIKLQNIIDQELARILKRNPNAKVKFMAVRLESNATNDSSMQRHLMLVLDYDNSINKGIIAIHNDDNGGVIESQGKKYLVIGVAGYRNGNFAQQSLYNVLWNPVSPTSRNSKGEPLGLMIKPKKEFFETHPNDRFYVNESLSTEIVPYSLIPGYIVKQGLNDSNTEFRSVRELLADNERNPMGYDMQSVAWGIQELTKFLTVGTSIDKVMVPRNTIRNAGSAFVLMPAGNGKMVPSYLKVLKYNEMKDSALKDKVEGLLQNVVSPDYATRYQAVIDLSNIFYFDKEGDTILLRKNKAELSLVHDGIVQKTFVLDSNFDRAEFMKAMEDMNPRVNVTARVLQSQELLNEYDEAGALMTDAAMFGTAGSSYSIYGLDGEGNMLKPEQPVNEAPKTTVNSDFKNENKSQVIYKHQYYTYRVDDGMYYLNGEPITDEKMIKQLEYNKMIVDNQLTPIKSEGVWEYFILKEGEHPEAIKVNRNTKEVKEVSEEKAKNIISKIEEEKAKKQREAEAQKQLKIINSEDVDVIGNSDNTDLVIDPNTGEMVVNNTTDNTPAPKEENKNENKKEEVKKESKSDKNNKKTESSDNTTSTQTFAELISNKKHRINIIKLVKGKWKDAPVVPAQLEKFLRDKDVEVDSIGTSKKDIDAWKKTIEDCR